MYLDAEAQGYLKALMTISEAEIRSIQKMDDELAVHALLELIKYLKDTITIPTE